MKESDLGPSSIIAVQLPQDRQMEFWDLLNRCIKTCPTFDPVQDSAHITLEYLYNLSSLDELKACMSISAKYLGDVMRAQVRVAGIGVVPETGKHYLKVDSPRLEDIRDAISDDLFRQRLIRTKNKRGLHVSAGSIDPEISGVNPGSIRSVRNNLNRVSWEFTAEGLVACNRPNTFYIEPAPHDAIPDFLREYHQQRPITHLNRVVF